MVVQAEALSTMIISELLKQWIKWLKWVELCKKCGMNPETCELEGKS